MRLVCPNCAAQYEVDSTAIPEAGRNVQCANCGDTWHQDREGVRETPPEVAPEPAASTPVDEPVSDHPPQIDPDDEPEAELDETPTFQNRPKATPVDPSVLDILRSEAELEAAARSAEETEDEPASDPAEKAADAHTDPAPEDDGSDQQELSFAERARAERARLNAKSGSTRRGEASPDADRTPADEPSPDTSVSDVSPAPKRAETPAQDMPDVEALNSSLRPADESRANEQAGAYSEQKTGRSTGYRVGFYLAVLVALGLLAIYLLEAQIAEAFPEAAPYLTQYVAQIQNVRQILADGAAKLIALAQNLIAKYL